MELLIGFLFEFLLEVVFAGIFAGAEYGFARTGRRFWMWALGLCIIAFVLWWRGPALWTTWLLAAGWLALLIYLDRRIVGRSPRVNEHELSS